MPTYPEDRFDRFPDDLLRVGAHRQPRRTGSGWITFTWAAVATALLILLGVVGLVVLNSQTNLSLPFFPSGSRGSPSSTSLVSPPSDVIDPTIAITVLNGTPTDGLAKEVGDALVAKGWAGVGARANADQRDVAVTFVYYQEPSEEDVARGVVRDLGFGEAQLPTAFDAPITVVLGADHKPIQ